MRPYLPKVVSKTVLLLLCMVIIYLPSFSQHLTLGNEKLKVEVGLNFGPTFFLGDLGGNRGKGTKFVKDVNLELTTLMKGAFISVYPTPWLGFRVAGQYTFVAGQDNLINNKGGDELYRKERNLDFKSHMWEAYAAIEWMPTMMFNKYDDYSPRLKPYGFAGIGLFHFDPMGSITAANGLKTWYRLQPLHTEGQGFAEYPNRKNYNLTQINIPFGAGLRFEVSERLNLSAELLYRQTFTDYIDDLSTTYIDPKYFDKYLSATDAAIARKIHDKVVANAPQSRTRPGVQRGNVTNDDAYFSTVVKVGIRLGNVYSSSAARNQARQTRCPHFY